MMPDERVSVEPNTEVPPVDEFFTEGKQVVPIFGPYAGQVLTMPTAEADQAIADNWAREHPAPFDPNAPLPPNLTPAEREAAEAAAAAWAATAAGTLVVVDSISPTNAEVGGPDLPLSVIGSGFNADTMIVFNGGDEVTTFVDSTRVMTILKPSTASGPVVVS